MYNVWIVDDEPFILEGLAAIVDWTSLQLVLGGQAENGIDALEQLHGAESKVDILITDIAMPEMDGLELIRTLKQKNPSLRSIILSGYNEFEYVREGMRIGIENYLLKPINLEELNATLSNTVAKLNRTQMESLRSDQIDLIKDNIMYRWVTGRISKEQWRQRADFLGLVMDVPSVVAVLLHSAASERRPEEAGYNNLVRQAAEGYLDATQHPFLAFQDIDDCTVIIIGMEGCSEASRQCLLVRLNGLQEALLAKLESVPNMFVGSFETGFDRAPASYQNALLTMDYAMLYPQESLLTYDGVTSDTERKGKLSLELETYSRLLLALDEEAVMERIHHDFDAFSAIEGCTPTQLRSLAAELIIYMKRVLGDTAPYEPFSYLYHNMITQIFHSTELDELKSYVLEMANEVMQVLGGRQTQPPIIRQVLDYVHTSYMEDFSLKTLGLAYRINPVYLGQLFQKEMNQSFLDYVNRYRIDKAKELMKNTALKTQDIAASVGYWDTAHFYKHFKKYVGVSPAQYRKLQA